MSRRSGLGKCNNPEQEFERYFGNCIQVTDRLMWLNHLSGFSDMPAGSAIVPIPVPQDRMLDFHVMWLRKIH